MNIGDKVFTYIDSYKGISNEALSQMYDQYKNSLIFIGDEQQIYNPLTGAYVGIGLSRFNQVINDLANNTSKLVNLDAHIHQNVVNSLWVDFALDELNAAFPDSSAPTRQIGGNNIDYQSGRGVYKLMTNQDLVIKGLCDTLGTEKRNVDELGNQYTNTINTKLWQHISRNPSNSKYKGASGIQVNIHHNGNYQHGIDDNGFEYSYWEGQDYLTIDDAYTWSYITYQSAYLMDYSKKIATSQANRIYHDILGGNDPVYIEKSFNDVFELDDDGNLKKVVSDPTSVLSQIYIRVKDGSDTGHYQEVFIHNDQMNGYYYVYSQFLDPITSEPVYYILKTNDPSGNTITGVDDGNGGTISLTPITPTALVNLLFPDDGYDKNDNGTFKEVAWFNIDVDATAQGQMNLADGIKTFREVAYILDKITDGPNGSGTGDGIITLTYNIAQNAIDIADIKNWKNNIGSYVVTDFAGSSTNQYVIVNSYSFDQWNELDNPAKGSARLDLDLVIAQTYTLNIEGTNVSYAAYLNIPSHTNYISPRWISLGDTTNDNYYVDFGSLQNADIQNYYVKFHEIFGNDSEQLSIYRKTTNPITGNSQYTVNGYVAIADLNNGIHTFSAGDYILFNYKKVEYPVINGIVDGLTSVNWVTTYVGHGLSRIIENLNNTSDEIYTYIPRYIHENLTYNDSGEQSNYYVSRVDEADGVVIIKREKLPLDTILASQEIYGDDFFVPITFDHAKEVVGTPADYSLIYYKDGNTYKHPVQLNSTDQYYLIAHSNNFTKIDTSGLSDPDGEENLTNELLLNGGGFSYFKRIGNELIDEGSSPEAIFKFIPVDINELIDDVAGYIESSDLELLYYYNRSSNPIGKYFDAFYRQNTVTGGNEIFVTSYVTYLGAATRTNTGLADAYDVRRTIESMFTWINLKTNKPYNRSQALNMQEAETIGG